MNEKRELQKTLKIYVLSWIMSQAVGDQTFIQVVLDRLAYPYDFGVSLTIFWAILRPYDCCQFPYDLANFWYFRKVFSHFIAVLYIIDRIGIKKTMSIF